MADSRSFRKALRFVTSDAAPRRCIAYEIETVQGTVCSVETEGFDEEGACVLDGKTWPGKKSAKVPIRCGRVFTPYVREQSIDILYPK